MTTATLPDRPPALPGPRPAWHDGVGQWARSNRLFTAALAVAVLVRLLVAIAYAPAIEFFGDSPSYLDAARHPWHANIWHPLGYPVFLWLLSVFRTLFVVTSVQHLLGLLTGVLVYRLVRGLGVGAAGATLAAAPVLFDAYQLDVEQIVLSDTLFTFLVVTAVVVAVRLVRHRGAGAAVALGALLGAATLTRTVGLFVAAVAVVVLVVARAGWSRIAMVVAACAVPVGGYVLAFHSTYGVYGLQGWGGRYLYGIVAPWASCDRAELPPVQRGLCPTLPRAARPGSNEYVWAEYTAAQLPGDSIEQSQIAGRFAQRMAREHPGRFLATATGTVLHYVEPGRETGPRDWFVGSWQFPLPHVAPGWNIHSATYGFRSHDRPGGHIVVGLAQVLRGYQRVVFTPGPLLLVSAVAAAGAAFARRGDVTARLAAGLLAGAGVALLVVPAFSAGFDWRYLLPAQAVLVPAGVVAAHALRPRTAALPRRAVRAVAATGAAAVVVPGLFASAVYAAGTLDARTTVPLPAAQPVGDHLTVHVARPVLLDVRCWPWLNTGSRRLVGLVALRVDATSRGRGERLVQPGNFGISDAIIAFPRVQPAGSTLTSVVLSRSYPHVTGTVYGYVAAPAGTVRYVDPLGGGAAAWRYELAAPPHQPPIGSRCTGSTPWSGAKLDVLGLRGVPAFTQLDRLPFSYGLRRQAWRAYSYDVRFRAASATTAPGPWQYPPTWQRTTAREQALLNLSPGVTYCFQVRARDALDAVTAWSDPACTTRMYDDRSLPEAPAWERGSGQQGFYYGTYTATRVQDATIGVAGTFSRVALSLYRCPDCGAVDVYVGPQLVQTIDLAVPQQRQGLFLWTSQELPLQQSTVTLRVRSQDRMVAIDAFGLAR